MLPCPAAAAWGPVKHEGGHMIANAVLAWVVIGGLVLVGLFILSRRLLLWYWRVNEVVELLQAIERNTRPRG